MKKDRIAQSVWEEDTFTLKLRDYIRKQVDEDTLPLQVEAQQEVYTSGMRTGKTSTKIASKIDLKVFRPLDLNSDEFYFAWECKRIGLINTGLKSKYISQGLIRFIRGEYSAQRDTAGMIGYILDSNVLTITNEINKSMLRRRKSPLLSSSDHLSIAKPIEDFPDVYKSTHARLNGADDIEVYHLFLSFLWANDSKSVASAAKP